MFQFTVHRIALAIGAALTLHAAAACAPVRESRGYILNERVLASITPGTDTRDTVLVALGTPSAIGTFDPNSWYYIGALTEAVPYRAADVLDQQVVAISFGARGVVSDIQRYTLSDAMKINPTDRETPTRGRELGILEQLIGNLGRFSPGAARQAP